MQDQDDTTAGDPQPPQLTAIELRVLGALMEKQLTTPGQYPLTVNSILTACNQKSNREPITDYHQGELVRTLQGLEDKRFVRKEYGSRADKYSQLFMQRLELGKKHQAVLCLLMLRGPQTLSEISTRTQRMQLFSDKDELTHCIERLCEREVPYAVRLGHQPGQRGERFAHLFCGMPAVGDVKPSEIVGNKPSLVSKNDQDTLSLLESEIDDLNDSVKELKNENRKFRRQLEDLYQLTGHPPPSD